MPVRSISLAIVALLDLLRGRRFQKDAPTWRILVAGVVLLGITSALSLVGASYLSGVLTDTRYLLEFDIFRGIKLTFVLPMVLVAIAFATSIDSMIVGVGLAFLEVNILLTALTIGLATTIMAAIGLRLGSFLGSAIGKRAEILGGLVLIGIGTLILAEHLHFL